MAQASSAEPQLSASGGGTPAMPQVRLEVRNGGGRPSVFEVGDGGFLVGTALGCDLRLPAPNLPPVLCLLARHAGGASLRRLASSAPVLVNGRGIASTYLNDGDRVTVAGAELVLGITAGAGVPVTSADVFERLRVVEAAERGLKEGREQLASEKANWEQRRENLAAECRRQTETLEALTEGLHQQQTEQAALLTERESAVRELADARAACQRERSDHDEHVQRERTLTEDDRARAVRLREEAAALRDQAEREGGALTAKCQEWEKRLAIKHDAIHQVARRIQVARRKLTADAAGCHAARQALDLKTAEVDARNEQLQREKALVDAQHQAIAARQRDLQEKLADLEAREQQLAREQADLVKGQQQHQADLVRLDRLQEHMEKRQKHLEQQALDVDRRFEQLQRDSRELEEQAAALDAWREKLTVEQAELDKSKADHAGIIGQLDQRAAGLEGQQAMLATLRTRVERLREELRKQEQVLSDQQALHDAREADLRQRTEEMAGLRAELDNERELVQSERQRFEERRALLDAAVAQLRSARESLALDEAKVRERQADQDTVAAEQEEQASRLLARATQLEEWQTRLLPDRQALQQREAELVRSEQTLATLQEQVRRRSEEVNERLRQAAEQDKTLEERVRQAAADRQSAEQQLEQARKDLDAQAAAVRDAEEELGRREEAQRLESTRVSELMQTIADQRDSLAAERAAWDLERQTAAENVHRAKVNLEAARVEANTLLRQVPDLEARAVTALDRLLRAREHLREHLAEIHTYARQSRDDLEAARAQVQAEVERLRQRELAVYSAQDDHRLAVAAFRQQLIEWRGIADELRQNLVRDGDRLERREAAANEQAELLAATSARLEEHAGQLEQQHEQVAAQRGEVSRHLAEMRDWYRKKLRDLSGVDVPAEAVSDNEIAPPSVAPDAAGVPVLSPGTNRPNILSVTGDLEPGDRQLGELLRSLDLVDADTLTVLLLEARRQRRSLRQLLLAGNYLTLYQMALIEAGNLDALMLGPVRVIDRLPSSPHEIVFRVFDPRHSREALLRHLAEAEMHDAVRPDEFRQRFTALVAVTNLHLAGTFEVLDIAGRPAVLQEWLKGLPSSEWSSLASAPGVWFRLLAQAATALQTAHAAGLVHGRLERDAFVITPDGVLKIVGLGEPRWLTSATDESEPSAGGDLAALGAIAAAWASSAVLKKGKARAFPRELHAILDRLTADTEARRYPSATALLDDLDGKDHVPANAAAWERFLQHVREESVDTALRRSA